MFARIVTMPLKPGTTSEFVNLIEKSVVPLLRMHKGFQDEMALVSEDGKTGFGISFWDSKENAEAYQQSGYGDVMKALTNVSAGPAERKDCAVTFSTRAFTPIQLPEPPAPTRAVLPIPIPDPARITKRPGH